MNDDAQRGTHRLTVEGGHQAGLIVYGMDKDVSYGYPGGLDLEGPEIEVVSDGWRTVASAPAPEEPAFFSARATDERDLELERQLQVRGELEVQGHAHARARGELDHGGLVGRHGERRA